MAVDVVIVALVVWAAYTGARRGGSLAGLELVCFGLATVAAFVAYPVVAVGLKAALGTAAGLANLTAFLLLWITVEISLALAVRWWVLPRLHPAPYPGRVSRAAGGVFNIAKYVACIALVLVLFAGLPLSASAKRPVVEAALAKAILGSSTAWQGAVNATLGRALGDTLTTFTAPAESGSEERVELEFTTTEVKDDPAAEATMLRLVNKERTARGLVPLTANTGARDVARAYGRRMLAEGYFSHIDNDKHTPFDRLRAGRVDFGAAGENLALAPTLQLAHDGLMNSPGHRANILNTAYTTVGIGIVDAGPYGLMAVQEFTD